MKIELDHIFTYPDGSADYNIEVDDEAAAYLMRLGITEAIKIGIAYAKDNYTPDESKQMELFDENGEPTV